jgi:hypothetical protein
MKPAVVVRWLLTLCVVPIFAASPTQERESAVLSEEAVAGEASAKDGEAEDYTIFNGLKVPPMVDIEGDKFAETVKDGYWYANEFLYVPTIG